VGLFVLSGFLLSEYAGWKWALPALLVAGLLVAPLIPSKGSCGIGSKPEE